MKIISWNARGLGNPSALRHLRLLVQQQTPQVLFIMESKLVCNSVSRLCRSLKFANGLEVPRVRFGGGMLLFWKDSVDVTLIHYNTNIFDCYVKCNSGPTWHFTAFYGAPDIQSRHLSWKLLERCKDIAPSMPWLVIGDFNEILSNIHKQGGNLRSESQMDGFRNALDRCSLFEQPFTGDPFTWIKGRRTVDVVKERLDWCFVNACWKDFFMPIITNHLDYYKSDHRAISVEVVPLLEDESHSPPQSRFRFEKLWLNDPEATEIIKHAWKIGRTGVPIDDFCSNINDCATSLQRWHRNKFGGMKKKIKEVQKSVANLNSSTNRTPASMNHLKTMEDTLDDLLAQEETY